MLAATARKYKLKPVRILAVDTSSGAGSLALLSAGRLLAQTPLEGQRYSLELLPAIERLLDAQGSPPEALDALAVCVGPGAFTGLRVGIGTAQGLAVGLGRPCVGVNAFEAWAELHGDEVRLGVLLDALRGEVLGALFERGRSARAARHPDPESLAAELPAGTLLVGPGAQLHRDALAAHALAPRFGPSPEYLAPSLARLAQRALESGARGAARELRPIYLREAYARQP